jgi:hypothetical protein
MQARHRQSRPGTGASGGSDAHQHGSLPASMPQLNGAPQRAQRELFSGVGVGEGMDGPAQELELVSYVAAAVADGEVHA